MFRPIFLATAVAFASVVPALPACAEHIVEPACAASDLKLGVSPSHDNGMMHDATILTLQNTSGAACSVPGHPHVSLFDAHGHAIVADATTAAPRFMHPGPVIVPVNVKSGDRLTTEIRWLRDDGDGSHAGCETTATVSLEGVRAPLASTICAVVTPGAAPQLEVKLYRAR